MAQSAHIDTFALDRLPDRALWPELITGPDTDYPERFNCAAVLVDERVAQGDGDRLALQWRDGERLCQATYADLQALTNRIAQVLVQDMGLVPGNRVLLRGPNNLMMAASWLAAVKAGLVTVPTMPLLRAKELKQVIDKAQIAAALCDVRLQEELAYCMDAHHPHYCPDLQQVRYFNDDGPDALDTLCAQKSPEFAVCATAADDVCLIAFTSGTTGMPKGCMHFHRDVLAMCDLFPRHVIGIHRDDVVCGTPPLAFTFGLGGLLCFPLRVGACAVLGEKMTPDSLLDTIQTFKATLVFTAPTFYRQMAALATHYDLRSLRASVSAGEALPDATRTLWREATGLEMIDGIGGTEMIHVFISAASHDVRPGAIGRVVPGYVACIVDEHMQPVSHGTPGRLALKGPTGCRYLDDARQRKFVQQGWNIPGDVFVQDADGYFYYQGRNDDMIISAGYNIAGPEVEDGLLQHEAVAECGVVGVPDDERGQIVKAFVILRPGYEADAAMAATLQDFVKRTVAPYKYPRAIEFVQTLPRTETGKLKRFTLREQAAR
ncbi:MAG: 2-aminobenzoate-CoA ligase [Comamonadaceae bacterium]|nr:MAG: 2-aminobenzoate-CoA ligase [Comamonadaceae bacterium]